MDDIEQWLRTKPSRQWRPNSLIRIPSLLLPDLRSHASSTPSGRICEQLRMTTFLE